MSWMFVASLISVRTMSSNLSCGRDLGGIFQIDGENGSENERRALMFIMETPIVAGTDG